MKTRTIISLFLMTTIKLFSCTHVILPNSPTFCDFPDSTAVKLIDSLISSSTYLSSESNNYYYALNSAHKYWQKIEELATRKYDFEKQSIGHKNPQCGTTQLLNYNDTFLLYNSNGFCYLFQRLDSLNLGFKWKIKIDSNSLMRSRKNLLFNHMYKKIMCDFVHGSIYFSFTITIVENEYLIIESYTPNPYYMQYNNQNIYLKYFSFCELID